LAMPKNAQDTGDLVTVDAYEAVPIYEMHARGMGERGRRERLVQFFIYRVAKRPSRMQVGVVCTRIPIRAQMHAGYVVLRVPCAKGY